MRYVHSNFVSNFMGAVNSKDVDLTLDIWVNEVSDLVIDATDEVISLLNKTGVKAEKTDSYEQLIDKILDNINSNTLLNKGISFLIAQRNNITPDKNKDWKKIIDSIGDKYNTLFKSTLTNEKFKAAVKSDLMEHIKSKSVSSKSGNAKVVFTKDTVEGKRKRNIKIALYVAGGIAVVAAIYYGLDWYKKNKLSFENGGALPAPTPLPTPAPIQPQMAAPVTPVVAPIVSHVAPTPTI